MEPDYRKRYQDFKSLLSDIDITVTNKKSAGTKSGTGDNTGAEKDVTYTQTKRVYIAAVMKNGLFNKAPVPKGDIFKIGRSLQSSHYVISGDTNISRLHCYLRFDGKEIYLTDNSANGTFFADGTRLIKNKEYHLKPGTRFYLATANHMLVVNME